MTKLEEMTNDSMMNARLLAVLNSSFVLPSLLDIRALSFSISLEQSIDANRDQKHRTHKRIALKERAIDSRQIALLRLVLIEKRRRD